MQTTDNEWYRVAWDEEGWVTMPEWLVNRWTLSPCLVRYVNFDGTNSCGVSRRSNLEGENDNYKAVYVAEIVYPCFAGDGNA